MMILGVAHDEDLANRIHELMPAEPDVSERSMFGGLVFLIGGHRLVAPARRGAWSSGSTPRTSMSSSPSRARSRF
jgi:hypothetical protein